MKKELRKYIRSQKAAFSPGKLVEMSSGTIRHLLTHPLYQKAHTILLYHSLPDEVNTHELIAEACKTKTVLLPTVAGDELELHIYTAPESVHTGSFSIIESDGPLFTNFSSIDLAIIPGMAFDRQCNRLGRGKGYYDRLLPNLHCPLIGLCFPFQLLDNIPVEEHDKKVDMVIAG